VIPFENAVTEEPFPFARDESFGASVVFEVNIDASVAGFIAPKPLKPAKTLGFSSFESPEDAFCAAILNSVGIVVDEKTENGFKKIKTFKCIVRS